VLETFSAERNAGSPTGREPQGDGVLIVVDGVTTVQGARESRVQGEGGQVTRLTQQGRHARCGAPKPFWASFGNVARPWSPVARATRHCTVNGQGNAMFRHRSLESCLRSKDSRAVWRGAVGKGPQGTSLAAYPTSSTVLNGLRHEVARVAVMASLRRT
jgi:hypothetical protein